MESFIGQALVFIGSAVILVPIFRQLGLGSVLGYLIAGILVGPDGLKLIPEAEHVVHFSELGVVFLLFIIGLEIHPGKLWAMRRHLFGLGGMQVFVSTIVFFAIGKAFGLDAVAAGVIGFGLSLSSTAFALQTLAEKNQLNTEFGRSSFSILLMQDLVAIPALALIPAFGVATSTTSERSSIQNSLIALLLIVGLVVVSRLAIRPAFRFIAATRAREIFTAATLLVVLGVAALMQKVGLSAALGTFIAGVLLADSEYRHEIEADLEPFKSLLMGLFFIGVGMGVSLDVIADRPLEVIGLAIGYLILKSAILYASGRAFKLNHENAKMMAITISQGGEFAFVIFGIGLRSQIAQTETTALLTAVITLSMALSPLITLINERLTKKRNAGQLKHFDQIKDESPEIIIAGFGRFGQIFGRILRSQDIPFVAIDHDSDQIELVRRFGNKVYYGDVARVDLLEAAGAARAKYFVLAIDDVEVSLHATRIIRQRFPHLKIFARARNRGHAFDLMDEGVTSIKRETFDSSINFVQELLVDRGMSEERAADLVERFKTHDEIMLQEQYKVRNDDKMFVSVSKQGTAQLAQVLNEDRTRTYIEAPSIEQQR